MGALADRFFKFDATLETKAGQKQCSPWWRDELTKFFDAYEDGNTEWWICAGRGGAKSTVLYKLCVFFTLFGDFDIPPAETHYAVGISRNLKEAEKATPIISRWLTSLGVEHDPTSGVITIPSLRRGIRIVSASVAGTSGWRSFFVYGDEQAKWNREGEAAMLDADEVLASARAQTVTHARAPFIVASTPWVTAGSFYETITAGDADGRIVSGPVPSWVANPVITEAHTHRLERRHATWRREYGCEFSATFDDGYFGEELVKRATDNGRDPFHRVRPGPYHYKVAADPAFVSDGFGVAVSHVENRDGGPVVVVDYVHSLSGEAGQGGLTPRYAIEQVRAVRTLFPGGCAVLSDQHAAEALRPMFQERGLFLQDEPWSQTSKLERFEFVKNLMRDGRLRLPDCPHLRRELANIGIKRTSMGNEAISSRGRDDRVFAVVQAAWHAAQGGALVFALGTQAQPQAVGARRMSFMGGVPEYDTIESKLAASIASDTRR
jgi:hypothetical protein